MQRQLSQYFRNQRRYSKPKASAVKDEDGPSCSAAKIAKINEKCPEDLISERRNLELLRDYKVGAISGKTFSTLVNETYNARRTFIQSEVKSCIEVLDMCPYFRKVENVSSLTLMSFSVLYKSFLRFLLSSNAKILPISALLE